MTDAEMFWSMVDRDGPYSVRLKSQCWMWMGYRCPATWGGNYGQATVHGRSQNAHRIAWELTHGITVPQGLIACHACDNPPCVNPAHIWIGTKQHNSIDRVLKGRMGRIHPHFDQARASAA